MRNSSDTEQRQEAIAQMNVLNELDEVSTHA